MTARARIRVPDHVLVKELDGEAVLLDLASETYFGLNATGLAMWRELTSAPSLGAGIDRLQALFDVPEATLRRDVGELVDVLRSKGLVRVERG